MLKFFLSAVGSSFLANTLLHTLSKGSADKFELARKKCTVTDRTPTATLIGGTMLGAGMAMAATCPGTVASQVGSFGSVFGLPSILGGFAGVAVYAFLVEPLFRTALVRQTRVDVALDRKFKVPYASLALPLAGLMMGVATGLEYLFPDRNVPLFTSSLNALLPSLKFSAWNPIISGVLLGLLQVPLVLGLRQSLGVSSGYVAAVAKVVNFFSPKTVQNNPVLKEKLHSNWQMIFLTGAALAAAYTTAKTGAAWNTWLSFFGGMIMIMGARMGDGCTSGHGISGFSQLSLYSMLGVPALFIGAIAAGVGLKMGGVL